MYTFWWSVSLAIRVVFELYFAWNYSSLVTLLCYFEQVKKYMEFNGNSRGKWIKKRLICRVKMIQNINKPIDRAIENVSELPFSPPIWLISGFLLPFSRYKHVKVKLCQKKCCNFSKKQLRTISNREWRVKLVDH